MYMGYLSAKGCSILLLTLGFLAVVFCFNMYIQKKNLKIVIIWKKKETDLIKMFFSQVNMSSWEIFS